MPKTTSKSCSDKVRTPSYWTMRRKIKAGIASFVDDRFISTGGASASASDSVCLSVPESSSFKFMPSDCQLELEQTDQNSDVVSGDDDSTSSCVSSMLKCCVCALCMPGLQSVVLYLYCNFPLLVGLLCLPVDPSSMSSPSQCQSAAPQAMLSFLHQGGKVILCCLVVTSPALSKSGGHIHVLYINLDTRTADIMRGLMYAYWY